ncbi:MAG: LOG family protein [Bacilli bacterium]
MESLQYAFVGCSSSDKIDSTFNDSAKRLGFILSQNGFNLVFGVCNYGLMGEVYRTMKQNNSSVIGVAPTIYKEDFKSLQCDEEHCVDTTNERISLMIGKSDILCFLAGGTGTLEEIIVAIEMKRRKEIDKPIITYDESGFYLPLVQQLENMERYRFSNDCTTLFDYITNSEMLNTYLGNLTIDKRNMKK